MGVYSAIMLVDCETTKNAGEYLHITLKGVATELSRKQYQSGHDLRGLLKFKYISHCAYSWNDLQVFTEYCTKIN